MDAGYLETLGALESTMARTTNSLGADAGVSLMGHVPAGYIVRVERETVAPFAAYSGSTGVSWMSCSSAAPVAKADGGSGGAPFKP